MLHYTEYTAEDKGKILHSGGFFCGPDWGGSPPYTKNEIYATI